MQHEKQMLTQTVTEAAEDSPTDLHRWRLLTERGRQTWHCLVSDEENKAWPQSIADKYFLGLPTVCIVRCEIS